MPSLGKNSDDTQQPFNRTLALIVGTFVGILTFLLIYPLLRHFLRRLQRFLQTPAVPPHLELEAVPETEARVEAEPAAETAEEIVSFGLPVGAVEAEPVPDVYTPVPDQLLFESFDPLFEFNWQNPHLLDDIYPFRLQKLVDFLAYFTEIDLLAQYKARGIADPSIQAKIKESQGKISRKRAQVKTDLEQAITQRKLNDASFAGIKGSTQRNLRFKQTYYLDREIERLEEKLANLTERRATLLKRIDWYPPEDTDHRVLWQNRANALTPEIKSINEQLKTSQDFRRLFDLETQLPDVDLKNITLEDVVRWELRERRVGWESKHQTELLTEIITDWFNRNPDRFPEWLVYMVIHFSGMRYMSSHASWADPCHLVELLRREDLESEVDGYTTEQLDERCRIAIQELENQPATGSNGNARSSQKRLINRLRTAGVKKRAYLEYWTARELDKLSRNENGSVCLSKLKNYKQEKSTQGDPIPEWVWSEIVKYTPLRLETDDPDWEAYSPERWKWTNRKWAEVLNTWEQKDITGWRQKHRQTLDLVVTRAVCNEVAEHIQHLRGINPAAGLTAKPSWYIRQAEEDPRRAYFVQSPQVEHFKRGASILWLDWVERQPNAWQVARQLRGYSFFPGQGQQPKQAQKGVIRKRDLEKQLEKTDNWKYQNVGNAFIRTQKKPSRSDLRRMGKSRDEIRKIISERTTTGNFEKQYLRWTHEATVVGVFEMLDGPYVMTFETGKIGVITRPLYSLVGNPMVFVGYVPPRQKLPPEMERKLVNMLRWDRILPEANLPARVRPRFTPDEGPAGGETEAAAVEDSNQSPVMVIRDVVKTWKVIGKDNQGRAKMRGAIPPVKLSRTWIIQVSTNHKETAHDAGDGRVNSREGEFLKISSCPDNPEAEGLFVHAGDTVDYNTGKWVQLHPGLSKSNPQALKGYDDPGKPFFEPAKTAIRHRVQIQPGDRVRVSTTHKESFVDQGDGVITATGLKDHYYLILECPPRPDAVGLFIPVEDVTEVPED